MPLAAVALQWHSKIKYVTSMIIGQSVGAIVVARKAWDALSPEQQAVVIDESKILSGRSLVFRVALGVLSGLLAFTIVRVPVTWALGLLVWR